MALVCGRLSGNADIVKASMNAPPMKQGAHGEGVKVLQLALIDLGTFMPRSTGGGATLPDAIAAETGAGACCGSCRPLLLDIIEQHAGALPLAA